MGTALNSSRLAAVYQVPSSLGYVIQSFTFLFLIMISYSILRFDCSNADRAFMLLCITKFVTRKGLITTNPRKASLMLY